MYDFQKIKFFHGQKTTTLKILPTRRFEPRTFIFNFYKSKDSQFDPHIRWFLTNITDFFCVQFLWLTKRFSWTILLTLYTIIRCTVLCMRVINKNWLVPMKIPKALLWADMTATVITEFLSSLKLRWYLSTQIIKQIKDHISEKKLFRSSGNRTTHSVSNV